MEAVDGATAIGLARAVRPELVLLDIGLPGMDGFEVATELRKHAEMTGVPIVLLSAFVTRLNEADFARRAGAVVALPKPCSPEELLDAVAKVFAGELP